MSIIIRKFTNATNKAILLRRYINDIFMIRPRDQDLSDFMNALNNHHPNLRFTHILSSTSIDFFDFTLATKTYQKPQNLYQYLHYTSSHPRSVHKGLIIGECIRYVTTNTERTNYAALLKLLTTRLLKRQYPIQFITKCISKFKFELRQQYLKHTQPNRYVAKPIFNCPPPPQYQQLKDIILHNFWQIQHLIPPPLIIPLRHKTIRHLV